MLTVAFGESIMSRTQVQLQYNRFKEGRENVNDENGYFLITPRLIHDYNSKHLLNVWFSIIILILLIVL